MYYTTLKVLAKIFVVFIYSISRITFDGTEVPSYKVVALRVERVTEVQNRTFGGMILPEVLIPEVFSIFEAIRTSWSTRVHW